MYDINNVFWKILQNDIPCKKIYENDYALSFYDINPKAKIHALVIPKKQYRNILDFTSQASIEEIHGFFTAVKEVTTILKINDGFQSIANTGAKGGQEVDHFHLHLLRH